MTNNISTNELIKSLKLNNNGLDDEYFKTFLPMNIHNNEQSTIFPLNTPFAIVGQKGSGKTYLMSSIIQFAYKNKNINRVIYIYADNVDNTIIRALPRTAIMLVPKELASMFLNKYLKKKTKFTSCFNFLKSYLSYKKVHKNEPELDDLYYDNLLNSIIKDKQLKSINQIKSYCNKVITKYMNNTQLNFMNGRYVYNLGRFTVNDFDMIVIDDIAQFETLFGTTRNNSPIYKYFTITRQNKTTFYMTAQEIKQIPRMLREMLGGIAFMNGSNVADLNDLKIDARERTQMIHDIGTLKGHDVVVYNFNTREYELVRNNK